MEGRPNNEPIAEAPATGAVCVPVDLGDAPMIAEDVDPPLEGAAAPSVGDVGVSMVVDMELPVVDNDDVPNVCEAAG
jgi:hypothetical protein